MKSLSLLAVVVAIYVIIILSTLRGVQAQIPTPPTCDDVPQPAKLTISDAVATKCIGTHRWYLRETAWAPAPYPRCWEVRFTPDTEPEFCTADLSWNDVPPDQAVELHPFDPGFEDPATP